MNVQGKHQGMEYWLSGSGRYVVPGLPHKYGRFFNARHQVYAAIDAALANEDLHLHIYTGNGRKRLQTCHSIESAVIVAQAHGMGTLIRYRRRNVYRAVNGSPSIYTRKRIVDIVAKRVKHLTDPL